MCLAIVKSRNSKVPVNYLANGYASNPHGAGFAVARDGEVKIHKGFFTFDAFLAAYQEHVRKEDPALIHFRMATHGYINKDNCHPFKINSHYVMIHNGVIPGFGTRTESDTRQFAKIFLRPLMSKMDLNAIEFKQDPSDEIDGFNLAFLYTVYSASLKNKIALLGKKGDFLICGESGGQWIKGVWYSNSCMMWGRGDYLTRSGQRDKRLVLPNLTDDEMEAISELDADLIQQELDAEQRSNERRRSIDDEFTANEVSGDSDAAVAQGAD